MKEFNLLKTCSSCGVDCSDIPRFKDPNGNYFCQPCYEKLSEQAVAAPASPPGTDSHPPVGRPPSRSNVRSGPARRGRGRGRLVTGIGVGLLLIVVAGIGFQFFRKKIEVRRMLADLSAAGYPTTTRELDAWYGAPSGKNAADTYVTAFARLSRGNNSGLTSLSKDFPDRVTTQDLEVARRLVAANRAALDLLHQAAGERGARFPVNLSGGLSEMDWSHPYKMKRAVLLLQMETAVELENGSPEKALDCVRAGLAMARSLENDPFLVSQLVRFSTVAITLDSLERVLSTVNLPDDDLVDLQRLLKNHEESEGLHNAIVGERVLGLGQLQMSAEQRQKMLSEAGIEYDGKLPIPSDAEILAFLKTVEKLHQIAAEPLSERLSQVEQVLAQIPNIAGSRRPSQMLLLPLIDAFAKDAGHVGLLRAARTALAIERYRQDGNGDLPATLDDLMPRYIDSVPTDPFDGTPLRYRQATVRGYSVYSVGENRIDDGGDPRSDVIFTVRR